MSKAGIAVRRQPERSGAGRLARPIHRAQALGAHLDLHFFAIDHDRRLLHIRFEGAIRLWRAPRPAARRFVPDVAPKTDALVANHTLCHISLLPRRCQEYHNVVDTLAGDYTTF